MRSGTKPFSQLRFSRATENQEMQPIWYKNHQSSNCNWKKSNCHKMYRLQNTQSINTARSNHQNTVNANQAPKYTRHEMLQFWYQLKQPPVELMECHELTTRLQSIEPVALSQPWTPEEFQQWITAGVNSELAQRQHHRHHHPGGQGARSTRGGGGGAGRGKPAHTQPAHTQPAQPAQGSASTASSSQNSSLEDIWDMPSKENRGGTFTTTGHFVGAGGEAASMNLMKGAAPQSPLKSLAAPV